MKKILTYLICCLLPFMGASDVLLWTIDDNSFVDSSPMATFVSPLPDDEDNWAVGRVKITTGNGDVIYPDLAQTDSNPNNPPTYYPGAEGVWIGGGGDFWGAEWNQSVLPANVDSTTIFIIELGMNHYNYDTGEIDFELFAYTDPHTYEQLQNFMYPLQDLNPMTATPWNPTYYHTSPEPNTCILILTGIAFLALRRKRA